MERNLNRFEALYENIIEALIEIDIEGKIITVNKRAEELLNLSNEEIEGKNIKDIIPDNKLQRIMDTGNIELDQEMCINGRNLLVNRIPVIAKGKVEGAIAIFQDVTLYREMKEKMFEDKLYIDVINLIMSTFDEWIVLVDQNGVIQMMSEAYKEFVNDYSVRGKHVTQVIENTRMHIVAKSGVMETCEIQEIRGNKMIATRVPIKKEGKIVGAIGKVVFKDIGDFHVLSKKINDLEKQVQYYKNELNKESKAKYSFADITGNSARITEIKQISKKVAKTDSNVLIFGESGTGKELFAHAIHNASKRYLAPFIKINCGAIPEELLEAELFGYEEGAFTGARKGGKKGKFEIANGGTILLDEIGDMPLQMQVKLLRVIQEREIERVGGNKTKQIDVRIIAATNKNLEECVKKGTFREDLYYRLNVMKISIPSLRERIEDIECLANALRIKVCKRLGIYIEGISQETIELLRNYNWPGNIRELENVIERAINLIDSDLNIMPHHLPERIANMEHKQYDRGDKQLKQIIEKVEKDVIEQCLAQNHGNKNKTAKLLGISRAGLYKKIEQYQLICE